MIFPPKTAVDYNNIVLILEGRDSEVVLDKQQKKRLRKKALHYILIDKMLYLRDEIEGNHLKVFHSEQTEAMEVECKAFHQLHHRGVNRFEASCNKVFFKIPREIIRKVVSECITCGQAQLLKCKERQVHITASKPMERIMIDLIDMARYKKLNDGYCWVLTIIDVYSKFAWAFPLKSKTGEEVTKNLEFLFYKFTGPPKILQSDNGKEFCNSFIKKLCEDFKIVQKHSRPRHTQSNGQIERFNQTLTRTLQKHVFEEGLTAVTNFRNEDEKEWLKHLDKVVYSYNLSKHSATKQVPFELFLKLPGFNTVYTQDENESSNDSMKEIEMILETENNRDVVISVLGEKTRTCSVDPKYLARMDRHSLVHTSKYTFKIGDKVIIAKDFDNNIKTKKLKLSSFFSKEVTITEILSNNRVKVETEEGTQIIPMSRLKKL